MNTKLLRKIKKHIEKEPRRWSYAWAHRSTVSPCGTQGCIAGWAMVLSGKVTTEALPERDWCMSDAAEALDLSNDEATRLFTRWPKQFVASGGSRDKDYEDLLDLPENAIARIDFFLKTKGTDVLPVPKPRKAIAKEKT